MKLLLDENLPRSLCANLDRDFPGTTHVGLVRLASSPDEAVWQYALDHGFTLVSKDSDFNHLAFLRGAPPKVVWLRLGNCSVRELADRLGSSTAVIREFIDSPEAAVLLLSRNSPPLAT